jgi:hypothetical protein
VLKSPILPETKISEGFHIFAFCEAISLNTLNTPKKKRAHDLIYAIRKLAKLTECQFSTEVTVQAKQKSTNGQKNMGGG